MPSRRGPVAHSVRRRVSRSQRPDNARIRRGCTALPNRPRGARPRRRPRRRAAVRAAPRARGDCECGRSRCSEGRVPRGGGTRAPTGTPVPPRASRGRLRRQDTMVARGTGHGSGAVPRRSMASLPNDEVELRAMLLARLAGALRDEFSREPRTALSGQALELARRAGNPAGLAYALDGRAASIFAPDTVHECLTLATELRDVAKKMGDKERTIAAHWNMFMAHVLLGKMNAARADFASAAALTEELRLPVEEHNVEGGRAMLALAAGKLDAARASIDTAYAIGLRVQPDMAEPNYIVQQYTLFDMRTCRRGYRGGREARPRLSGPPCLHVRPCPSLRAHRTLKTGQPRCSSSSVRTSAAQSHLTRSGSTRSPSSPRPPWSSSIRTPLRRSTHCSFPGANSPRRITSRDRRRRVPLPRATRVNARAGGRGGGPLHRCARTQHTHGGASLGRTRPAGSCARPTPTTTQRPACRRAPGQGFADIPLSRYAEPSTSLLKYDGDHSRTLGRRLLLASQAHDNGRYQVRDPTNCSEPVVPPMLPVPMIELSWRERARSRDAAWSGQGYSRACGRGAV